MFRFYRNISTEYGQDYCSLSHLRKSGKFFLVKICLLTLYGEDTNQHMYADCQVCCPNKIRKCYEESWDNVSPVVSNTVTVV